jgi:hypothetical protein
VYRLFAADIPELQRATIDGACGCRHSLRCPRAGSR